MVSNGCGWTVAAFLGTVIEAAWQCEHRCKKRGWPSGGIIMKRAVGVLAILLLSGCDPVPRQQDAQLQMLETVEKGHLCDPRALMQAVAREHPRVDPATARRETDHLLYVLGCGLPDSAPPEQQIVSSAPSAPNLRAKEKEEEIPLRRQGNTYSLLVLVNGIIPIPFVLDTGAGDVLLPADVVFTLLRTGTLQSSDFISYRPYVLADGRELPSAQFKIRDLQVGQHTARDVIAGVGRLGSDPLLGQSFLSRFGSATIDYKRSVLVLSR
jgi:predicted aspartyl protease